MEVVLGDLFGSFGGLLSLGVVVFVIVMPVGIYYAMKNAVKISEEQDRIHAQKQQAQHH